MTYKREFGQREGLSERLRDWRTRLGKDKSLPWVGLGLLDDLVAAADALDGADPEPEPEPEDWEIAVKQKEYDL
jgi:hypothetical protein